jgi:TP901 family phage tail tape measure protein
LANSSLFELKLKVVTEDLKKVEREISDFSRNIKNSLARPIEEITTGGSKADIMQSLWKGLGNLEAGLKRLQSIIPTSGVTPLKSLEKAIISCRKAIDEGLGDKDPFSDIRKSAGSALSAVQRLDMQLDKSFVTKVKKFGTALFAQQMSEDVFTSGRFKEMGQTMFSPMKPPKGGREASIVGGLIGMKQFYGIAEPSSTEIYQKLLANEDSLVLSYKTAGATLTALHKRIKELSLKPRDFFGDPRELDALIAKYKQTARELESVLNVSRGTTKLTSTWLPPKAIEKNDVKLKELKDFYKKQGAEVIEQRRIIEADEKRAKESKFFSRGDYLDERGAYIQGLSRKVEVLKDLQEYLKTTTPAKFLKHFDENLQRSVKDPAEFMRNFASNVSRDLAIAEKQMHGFRKGFSAMTGSIIYDLKEVMRYQTRWYLARSLLFAPVRAGASLFKEGLEYIKEIDTWSGKLLRFPATSGKITSEMKQDISEIITEIRKTTISTPVLFEGLAKSAESFIGAGIPEKIVKKLIPSLAQLRVAFPEINAEQFGVAITGTYNALKDSMKGTELEAGKIVEITEKLLRAQARGIIRPEQFVQVTQHLGEMSKQAGFSLDEMLALSVVVTDLGSKAGSASRSLRGMMESLMKPRNLEALSKLGITIDKNRTLASQFIPTMQALRKALGDTAEGSGKSVGALSLLSQIFPVERVKSVTAAMDFLDKYVLLTKDIGSAQGGLESSSSAMASTMEKQLVLLKNRLNELSKSILDSTGNVKVFIEILNQLLLGALLSVGDKAVVAGKYVEDLSDAGKTAFVVFSALSGVFNTFKVILMIIASFVKALLTPFTALIDLLAGTGEGIKAVTTLLTGLFLGSIAITLTKVSFLATGFKNLIAFISLIPHALTSVSNALSLFATKNFKILAIFLAIAGATTLIERLNAKANAPRIAEEKETSRMLENLGKAPEGGWDSESLRIAAENTRKELEASRVPQSELSQYNIFKEPEKHYPTALKNRLAREKELEKRAEAFEERYTTTLVDERSKQQVKAAMELSKDDKKLYGKRDFTQLKKDATNQLKLIADREKEANLILESSHKLGLIGDENYQRQKLANIEKFTQEKINVEQKLLDKFEEGGEIYKKYQDDLKKLRAQKGSQDAIDALNRDFENEKNEVKARLAELKILKEEGMVNAETEITQILRTVIKERHDFEINEELKKQKTILDIRQVMREKEEEMNKWLYDKGLMSARAYYNARLNSLNQELDDELKLIEIEKNKEIDLQNSIIEKSGGWVSSDWEDSLEGQTQEVRNAYYARKVAIENANRSIEISQAKHSKKLQALELDRKDSIKAIYDDRGISGVIGKAFEDLDTEWSNIGQHIYDTTKNIITNMENSFADFFDYMSEGFMDFENLAKNVLHTIYMELLKNILLKQVLGGVLGSVTWQGGFGGFLSGLLPGKASGGFVSLNTPYIVGEAGPELFIPNASGNIIPNNRLGTSMEAPTLIVNVENKTGAQVKATQSPPQFDGKKWVRTVMLELANSDMAVRSRYGVR